MARSVSVLLLVATSLAVACSGGQRAPESTDYLGLLEFVAARDVQNGMWLYDPGPEKVVVVDNLDGTFMWARYRDDDGRRLFSKTLSGGALLREINALRGGNPRAHEMISYFESEILAQYPEYRGTY